NEILKEIFNAAPRNHWLRLLEKRDVPCAPIRTLDEVFQDPQVSHLERLVELKDPDVGTMQLVKNGVSLERTPPSVTIKPPRLGEHTEEILNSLGYTTEDMSALRKEGAI
ncbi:MAG: CoA transferase, partial [Deltaproteobacteria bacterium]|nr:CoA transferase [Deltaproteobacteria bacterium]